MIDLIPSFGRMRVLLSLVLPLFLVGNIHAQAKFVRFETSKGNIVVMLYDQTPGHRDMFLKAIKKGQYSNALFNRVIRNFVSQGGELDDTILNRERHLAVVKGISPEAVAKRLPAEIRPALFHKKGALGAGRDDNKMKASYFTQLYFVTGAIQTDAQLDAVEKRKGVKIPEAQRKVYKRIGGTPHLDGDYTVFGEIIEGMDVAGAINSVAVDQHDVPLEPVVFTVKVIKKR